MLRAMQVLAGLGLALGATALAAQVTPPPAPDAADLQAETSSADGGAGAGEEAPQGEPPAPEGPAIPPLGPELDHDAAMKTAADEIASYELRVELDVEKHAIHGEGTITWRNASRLPTRELWVHLYLNAFKNGETLFQRTSSTRFHGPEWGYVEVERFFVKEMGADVWAGRDKTSPGDPDDETDIRVTLPREVMPGETIHIDVAFESQLPALWSRTGYSGGFHMAAQWFPKLARLEPDGTWKHFPFHHLSEFYADFGTYDVTITAPSSYTVGGTGMVTEEHNEGKKTVRRFVQENIHDFAFTAWDGFHIQSETTDEGVVIRCLYPPGFDEAAALEIKTARFGLAHYGAAFGRYPYRKLLLVHPPPKAEKAGGMEYPMLITTGGHWYAPLTGDRSIELVTLHELGHQWFYGLVATNENASPFLDEGLTSYAEARSAEALYPNASLFHGLGISLGDPAWHRVGSANAAPDGAVADSSTAFAGKIDYGALVYYRTSTILATLGRVYGEGTLDQALGRYARRYRFEHPKPEHLLAAIRDVMGEDAAETLRAATFDRGWVDYAVGKVTQTGAARPEGIFGSPGKPTEPPAGKKSDLFRAEILVRRRGTLKLPVDVELRFDDGTTEILRWDAKTSIARLPYEGPRRIAAVVIDPERRVLLDADLTNNAWSNRERLLAPRVLSRATFAAEVALGLGAP